MRQVEGTFKTSILQEIEERFDGCVILQGNSQYLQGVPDVIVLYGRNWAALEFKRTANAEHQQNQDYYVDLLDRMSFSAFIYPENAKDVLYAMERSFKARR